MIGFREPPRTGFEIAWSLFGIRFRVFPSFFVYYGLLAAALIYIFISQKLVIVALGTAIDIACITVAFLFIGFVQALVYRSYGLHSTVILKELSAGTHPYGSPPYTIQRIVVALAYPAACALLAALVYYSNEEYGWKKTSLLAQVVYMFMLYLSMFWAIISLLPVIPYSGGQVMMEVLTYLFGARGLALALMISIAVAFAYIGYVVAVIFGNYAPIRLRDDLSIPASLFVAVFFALSASTNWQWLQALRAERRGHSTYDDYEDDRAPWQR